MGPQILHYFYIKYLTENWLMVAQTLPYFIVNVFVNWKLVKKAVTIGEALEHH
jgi:hypothetical protein